MKNVDMVDASFDAMGFHVTYAYSNWHGFEISNLKNIIIGETLCESENQQ